MQQTFGSAQTVVAAVVSAQDAAADRSEKVVESFQLIAKLKQ